MKKHSRFQTFAIAFGIVASAFLFDVAPLTNPFAVREADAIIGRPMTPGSVAGVARRTTRRTIRRSAIYVNALPVGCAKVNVNGTMLYHCGGKYYEPYQNQYVIVYVD